MAETRRPLRSVPDEVVTLHTPVAEFDSAAPEEMEEELGRVTLADRVVTSFFPALGQKKYFTASECLRRHRDREDCVSTRILAGVVASASEGGMSANSNYYQPALNCKTLLHHGPAPSRDWLSTYAVNLAHSYDAKVHPVNVLPATCLSRSGAAHAGANQYWPNKARCLPLGSESFKASTQGTDQGGRE